MNQEELSEKLEEAGIEISDLDMFWMERVYEHRQAGEKPSVGELLVKYHDDLPDDYIPSDQIDSELYDEGREEPPSLTVLGRLVVDEDSDIPDNVNAVLEAARQILLDDPQTTEIEADEVAYRLRESSSLRELEVEEVERTFGHVSELGSFWTTASGAKDADEGYSKMGFSRNIEKYILEYLSFDGFDSLLESKIENIKDGSDSKSKIESFTSKWTGSMSFLDDMDLDDQENNKSIGTLKNTPFIMMPMDPEKPFLEDVNNTIKDVCSEFSIEAIRADDLEHAQRITDVVIEHIQRCEFLIADLTDARPNVYYEVGYAHALDKRPILYRRQGAELHFDLSVHNVPEYKNITDLKEQLRDRFEAILGRKPESVG